MSRVYKILTGSDWDAAVAVGAFEGSADDKRDGFIHLSAPDQWSATLLRWFPDQDDLLLVAFEADDLGPALKWEPSRGGALFPHLYGPLLTAAAVEVRMLRRDADGASEAVRR